MTISLIPRKNVFTKDLLCFLGYLPGGIRKESLGDIWESTRFEEEIRQLKDLSLIEEIDNRYRLPRQILEFTQLDLKKASKKMILDEIIQFYTGQLKKDY